MNREKLLEKIAEAIANVPKQDPRDPAPRPRDAAEAALRVIESPGAIEDWS
jgi:hypothetical protein